MNKTRQTWIGLGALLLVTFMSLPALGQVQVQDLNYQAPNGAIEPGNNTAMDDLGGTAPAALGSGIVVMKFQVTDIDPLADDPSNVTITGITIENLGTATDADIVEVMCLNDNTGRAIAPVAAPVPGPNPNITFTAFCDPSLAPFFGLEAGIPDGGSRVFAIAVRTTDTNTLSDDSQGHTLVLRVTVEYEETVGSPPVLSSFSAVVTDGKSEFVWNGGLNSFTDDTYVVNPLMPGQQGVVSRFTVCDSDSNENNLLITELNIKQGNQGTALFTDISTLKIFRVENNMRTMVGSLTPTAAFDRGGAGDTLLLPTSVFLLDDRCTTFEIEAQVSPFAFKGKLIQLAFQLSTEEPAATAIDFSVNPQIQTRAATVIGKGLIEIPSTNIVGNAGGANVPVNVRGIPLPGLGTLQVGPSGAFTYDPSVVQVKDIVGVGDYTIQSKVIDNRRGEARFTVLTTDPSDALQNGTIAIIQMTQVGQAGQRSRLGLVFDQVTDANNIPITPDVGVSVGEIKIVPPGDIDGDGRTTISDALFLAAQLLLATPCSGMSDEQKMIADVAAPKAAAGTVPTCGGASPTLTSADVAEIARLAISSAGVSSLAVTVSRVAPLRVQGVLAAARSGGFEIQALGSGIAGLSVKLFNLAGQQVISQESGGNRLWLRTQDASGRPLANGVYLYVVTVKGINGEAVRSEVRKLVVLR